MGIFIFIVLVVISILGVVYIRSMESLEESMARLNEKIKEKFDEEGLNISQQYLSVHYSVLGLDENNQKVCFLDSNENSKMVTVDNIKYTTKTFLYKDILESEIIIDGETVSKTSRSSQIGGVVVGAVLAGGVGAIIGGLSGKTASKEKVEKIQLKVIVNDTKKPVRILTFLDEPSTIDRKNDKFIKANDQVMHLHSLFKVLIDKADKADKEDKKIEQNQNNNTPIYSNADEIRKLHDLLSEGIITQEEFNIQKGKIIS